MATASQGTLNQILFQDMMSSQHQQQLDFFCVSSSTNTASAANLDPFESAKALTSPPSLAPLPPFVAQSSSDNIHHLHRPQRDDLTPLFSLHTSIPNMWEWEEGNDERRRRSGEHSKLMGLSSMKKMMKKSRKKVREPRFSFKTMSDVDVLDDGYKWRKYGQKVVKNTHHPRSYYRCTKDNCRVKKRVERLAEDPRMVITTYEGRHAHSPSRDDEDDDSHSSSQCISDLLW